MAKTTFIINGEEAMSYYNNQATVGVINALHKLGETFVIENGKITAIIKDGGNDNE